MSTNIPSELLGAAITNLTDDELGLVRRWADAIGKMYAAEALSIEAAYDLLELGPTVFLVDGRAAETSGKRLSASLVAVNRFNQSHSPDHP